MKSFLAAALGLLAGLCFVPTSTLAQSYPAKPIKLTVAFAAGGPADVVARLIASKSKLGEQIVVDNKAGAGGLIGTAAVARSPADGYNLLFVTASYAGSGALYSKLGYDPKDFAPVIGAVRGPIVIAVNAKSKYKTIKELVDDAKAKPGVLNCAGGGGGATVPNLAFESLKRDLGLKINAIPYRGSAPAVQALLAGEIDCNSDNVSAILPHVKSGALRALAITTEKRFALLPDVPTVSETILPSYSAAAWFGVLAPAGTPRPIIDAIHKDFSEVIQQPQVRDQLQQMGMEPLEGSTNQFGEFVATETRRWEALITALGIKAD